ncbi:hypothetical protein NUW54_g10374 [Trametes sanguinea]|uniref:Uncharacterized protein n=1 Tax=Trametes sanguinea TaxID=158606 RepID=A0ACC1NZI5_9APHY|nr:hypothetical protein NUW54_g10374 [Trametes sanguinea]
MASHRLNSWRSEVHSSDMTREAKDSSSTASTKPSTTVSSSASMKAPSSEATVPTGLPSPDLKEPRKLHDDSSPPLLSTYDEPIRRVIEDMREQRMSLCQSLRQYVFVHRAIIEGALMIVDEEKRRERRRKRSRGERGLAWLERGLVPSLPSGRPRCLPGACGREHGAACPAARTGPKQQYPRVPEFVAANTIIEGVVSPSATASLVDRSASLARQSSRRRTCTTACSSRSGPSVKRRQRPSDVSGPRPQFDASTGVFALPPDAR